MSVYSLIQADQKFNDFFITPSGIIANPLIQLLKLMGGTKEYTGSYPIASWHLSDVLPLVQGKVYTEFSWFLNKERWEMNTTLETTVRLSFAIRTDQIATGLEGPVTAAVAAVAADLYPESLTVVDAVGERCGQCRKALGILRLSSSKKDRP